MLLDTQLLGYWTYNHLISRLTLSSRVVEPRVEEVASLTWMLENVSSARSRILVPRRSSATSSYFSLLARRGRNILGTRDSDQRCKISGNSVPSEDYPGNGRRRSEMQDQWKFCPLRGTSWEREPAIRDAKPVEILPTQRNILGKGGSDRRCKTKGNSAHPEDYPGNGRQRSEMQDQW